MSGAEKNTLPTVRRGGGSVTLRGRFASPGSGSLRLHWTFERYNDPRHTSKATAARFQKESLKILEWPSQFYDSNPTENRWLDLKKAVAARNTENIRELEAVGHEEWAKIPQERCQNLVSGDASHLHRFITAKGKVLNMLDGTRWNHFETAVFIKVAFCVELGETTCNILKSSVSCSLNPLGRNIKYKH